MRNLLTRSLLILVVVAVIGALRAVPFASAQDSIVVRIDDIDAASLPEVAVGVTARDANGVPLTGLTPLDFEVTEDRQTVPRDIQSVVPFVNPQIQIAVVLVIDISGSMQGQAIADARAAATQFVSHLSPSDSVALIAFNRNISLASPFPQLDPAREYAFTRSKEGILTTIAGLQAGGSTPLYDAAYKAVLLAAQQPEGNRAVLLMTDGKDEGSTPDQPGSSIATAEDAIQEANRNSIPVFTIGLGDSLDRQWLERLAMRTGGTYQATPTSGELTKLFQSVADLLKQQYRLTYRSGVPADGKLHYLRVDLKSGVLHAFDGRDYGPVPLQLEPTAVPPAALSPTAVPPTPIPPTPVPTPAPPSGIPWTRVGGIGVIAATLGIVGYFLFGRSRPAAEPLLCPTCGRKLGPDGICPDCKKPGVKEPRLP
ncbi:MAG TPA: VWA domain-containing protein [Anaerolineae bacterium]|nr:VWA domain-containing protein [Anaerolineae bacterium]HQJ51881.1 VWA domain-containing protein [Anaerolineae bacterium]